MNRRSRRGRRFTAWGTYFFGAVVVVFLSVFFVVVVPSVFVVSVLVVSVFVPSLFVDVLSVAVVLVVPIVDGGVDVESTDDGVVIAPFDGPLPGVVAGVAVGGGELVSVSVLEVVVLWLSGVFAGWSLPPQPIAAATRDPATRCVRFMGGPSRGEA